MCEKCTDCEPDAVFEKSINIIRVYTIYGIKRNLTVKRTGIEGQGRKNVKISNLNKRSKNDHLNILIFFPGAFYLKAIIIRVRVYKSNNVDNM